MSSSRGAVKLILVNAKHGGRSYEVVCQPEETGVTLKASIASATGVPTGESHTLGQANVRAHEGDGEGQAAQGERNHEYRENERSDSRTTRI